MGPGTLHEILSGLNLKAHPNLMVGLATVDDAGIYKLSEDTALVQTVDFFTPMVDDPFLFGQIAAANALSDVYAMGGEPLTAMNIACFPDCLEPSILREIIRGGLTKIEEAGALLVGGHTVADDQPKYGLAVTGLVHPARVITNQGARPGDLLYLTKPLGTGIVATAVKGGLAPEPTLRRAVESMITLNKKAKEVMVQVGVSAATDVTGFALLGHLSEMTAASGVDAMIWADCVPVLEGVRELAAMGLIPAGAYANRDYLQGKIAIAEEVDETLRDILYSPETSGGLLIALPAIRQPDMEAALADSGVNGVLIGRITGAGRGETRVLRRE